MFQYNICTEPDREIFIRQCRALEKHIPGLIKCDLLEDADGSEFQIYKLNDKEIVVHNSYDIGAVFIESDIDIDKYFS